MESDDSFIANLWRHKQARKHRSMRPNKQIYTKPVAMIAVSECPVQTGFIQSKP